MLHVILLILKIIGIILLAVLGLLLLIILTVLLVPIRYKATAEYGEEVFRVDARVNWIMHILRARVTHLEGVLHIRVKVLWFTLYDNLNPKQPRERRKKEKKSDRKTKIKKIRKQKADRKSSKTDQNMKEESETIALDNDAKLLSETKKKEQKSSIHQDEGKPDIASIVKTSHSPDPNALTKTDSKLNLNTDKTNINEGTGTQVTNKPKQTHLSGKKQEDNGSYKQEERISFLKKVLMILKKLKEKIISFFTGVKNKVIAIKNKFAELKEKVINLFKSASNLKHKIKLISDFIKDEINRQGFKITYSSLKRLIKHILPRKLKSRIVFGTGDPCSTGQALGVMSILYSFYGDKIQIIPDFEHKIFEGKHYARGRIRLITLLIIVVKLILDKRFQQLKKNYQILKEAL